MPERFKIQFTASQEYVDLLQQAKDLASHALPSGALEQLHMQAMRLLVAELKKRRCAALKPGRAVKAPRQRVEANASRQRVEANASRQRGGSHLPRRREHVPAAVRRAVWSRDGSRCTYVGTTGERCRETALLELHHLYPHARGGPNAAANLALRCRVHNTLAAEQDFGKEFIEAKRRQGSTSVAVPR